MNFFTKALNEAKAFGASLKQQIETLGIEAEALDLDNPNALQEALAANAPQPAPRDLTTQERKAIQDQANETFAKSLLADGAYDEELSAEENLSLIVAEHGLYLDQVSSFETVLQTAGIQPAYTEENGELDGAKLSADLDSFAKRKSATFLAAHNIDPDSGMTLPEGEITKDPSNPSRKTATGYKRTIEHWQSRGFNPISN